MAQFREGELEALMPTEAARKYVIENNITFNDWEKASFFYHGTAREGLDNKWLRLLRDEAEDEVLRGQITAYFEHEENALEAFKNNDNREYIYLLTARDPDRVPGNEDIDRLGYRELKADGYFLDWETAYEYGKILGFEFRIAKFRIADAETVEKLKTAEDKDDVRNDYDDESEVSAVYCDENGVFTSIDSREIPSDVGEDFEENFQGMYVPMPNPFERGDLVKSRWSKDCSIDIIHYTQEDWKKQQSNIARWIAEERERWGSSSHCWLDNCMGVTCLEEDGEFWYGDGNPLCFERCELSDDPEDKELNDFLLSISEFYKGKGSFEDVQYYQEQYRKAKGYDD